jgi:4-hydroxy-3-methylbut-2-enyl diphosphate reductase
MAVAPTAVRLLERPEDVDALDEPTDGPDGPVPMALLAQTTLSHDEWAGIVDRAKQRFPDLWMPGRDDLCFATTNRQAALKALAGLVGTIVVIGSANSSNTVALEKVARAFGCPRVIRVDSADELPDDLTGTVGVTAGASAPEALVEEVVARLAPTGGIEIIPTTVEEEYFPPPPELREILRGIQTAVELLMAAPPSDADLQLGEVPTSVLAGDRDQAAADVLDRLAG